jgi:hypothetical protein
MTPLERRVKIALGAGLTAPAIARLLTDQCWQSPTDRCEDGAAADEYGAGPLARWWWANMTDIAIEEPLTADKLDSYLEAAAGVFEELRFPQRPLRRPYKRRA